MADDADNAAPIIEAATEAAVSAARLGPFSHLKPNGWCRWCGEPVMVGRVHCRPIDDSCEEDHLKHLQFRGGRTR